MKSFSSKKQCLQILHLEDDQNDVILIKAELDFADITCRIVQIANQRAFEVALENGADLILSDSSVPGFNTLAALRMVRERHPEIPFVFLSGNRSPRLKEDMLRSGANAFLDKDDPSLLIGFIRQLLVSKPLKPDSCVKE
jgi:CheY-like chemotaxis protein